MSIRLVLIDNHALFRHGIKALLAHHPIYEVVAEAEQGLRGIECVVHTQPDMVLLAWEMPVMNGLETLAHIRQQCPQTAVIMLTASPKREDLLACMRLGARGFLLKNIDADFLLNALEKVAQGNHAFSPEMIPHLVQPLIQPQIRLPLEQLTARELEILGYLAAGHSNKNIARQLALNPPLKYTFKTSCVNSNCPIEYKPPSLLLNITFPNPTQKGQHHENCLCLFIFPDDRSPCRICPR